MENTRDLAERLALEVFDNCSADYFDTDCVCHVCNSIADMYFDYRFKQYGI